MGQGEPAKVIEPLADVVRPPDWENAPRTPWQCENCFCRNINWMPSVNQICGMKADPQWRKGLCPRCEAVRRNEEREEQEEKEKEERFARVRKLHTKAALPKELAHVKFPDLEKRPGAERAFKILENIEVAEDRRWVCLMGDNNVGKSRLLAAASNRQNGMLVPSLYINESQFFKQVRESWDTAGEAKVMSVFDLAELVLWDEFSFFNFLEREWIYERVYAILENLAERDKKVIFATNIMHSHGTDGKSIEGRCGKRVWARLRRRQTEFVVMQNTPFY